MSKKRKNGSEAPAGEVETPNSVPSSAPISKGGKPDEDEEDEEGEDEEEEDEEDDESVRKSQIALTDLEKGLAAMEAAGQTATGSRRDELFEKAKKGRLSAQERRELDAELDGRLRTALEGSEEIVKGMDVSPALDVLGTKVAEAVDKLAEQVERNAKQGGEFNSALTKSLIAVGDVLKAQQESIESLSDKLEKALEAPRSQPRAVAADNAKPTSEPKPGEAPTVNKAHLKNLLTAMHSDSIQKGMRGLSRSGLSIKSEMAKVLSNAPIDPQMARDVEEFAKAAR